MIKRRFLMFRAADGAASGGAAVTDAPAKADEAAIPSPGERFHQEMAKTGDDADRVQPPKKEEAKPADDKKADDAPKDKAAKADKAKKPASALDAALEPVAYDKKPDAAKPDEPVDYLKDIPETLPKDGKTDHWSKARGAIEKLGQTVAQQAKELVEVRKAAETAKATPSDSETVIAELRKELDGYKDALTGLNVQYHPEHRKKYIEGRAHEVDRTASKLEAYCGNADAFKKAMLMPDSKARTEAIKASFGENVDELDAQKVLASIAAIDRLDEERAEIESDPTGAWEKLQKTERDAQAKKAQELEGQKKSVFEKVAGAVASKIFLLRTVDPTVEGGEEHNARAAAIREAAWKLADKSTPPETYAEAAIAFAAYPILQEIFIETRKKLHLSDARLAEYESAEPGFHGGKPAKTDEGSKTPAQKFHEAKARLESRDE